VFIGKSAAANSAAPVELPEMHRAMIPPFMCAPHRARFSKFIRDEFFKAAYAEPGCAVTRSYWPPAKPPSIFD